MLGLTHVKHLGPDFTALAGAGNNFKRQKETLADTSDLSRWNLMELPRNNVCETTTTWQSFKPHHQLCFGGPGSTGFDL